MQSNGNRFGGDVVLDSFNMVYRHEDRVVDQKYKKQISRDLYYKILVLIKENEYLKKCST